MFIYFKIDQSTDTIIEAIESEYAFINYNTKVSAAINGKPYLVSVIVTDPAYDPATQVREGPVDSYDGTTATRVFTIRAKTIQELADEQTVKDIDTLQNAGKDAVLVLIELIEWQLANTAMTATDFSADVKQAFLDLQTIADRLRS